MATFTQAFVDAHQARHTPKKRVEAVPNAEAKESDLHDKIMAECRRRGWYVVHSAMHKRSTNAIGTPDFIIAAESRVIWVEAKSAKGKLRPEQAACGAWLAKLGHKLHVVRSMDEFMEVAK